MNSSTKSLRDRTKSTACIIIMLLFSIITMLFTGIYWTSQLQSYPIYHDETLHLDISKTGSTASGNITGAEVTHTREPMSPVGDEDQNPPKMQQLSTIREPLSPTRHKIQQYTYSNPLILEGGCIITILLADPTLTPSAFGALESVAANIHPIDKTCILIQTSLCRIQNAHNIMNNFTSAYEMLTETIYSSAKTLLRALIDSGNVRVTILDHFKYRVQSCDNFYVVSAPWMNYYYWSDYSVTPNSEVSRNLDSSESDVKYTSGEFVTGQDSDFVLTIQHDAVMCHGLDVYAWQEFAWVGAPWHPEHSCPDCGDPNRERMSLCKEMSVYWDNWHKASGQSSVSPPYPTDMCSNPNIGPVGNGGFSLRSRRSIREAIRYCPHSKFSGLSTNSMRLSSCIISQDFPEDVYFGTILRGLSHNKNPNVGKMPSVFEAVLFSSEMAFLAEFISYYKRANHTSSLLFDENIVRFLWRKSDENNSNEDGWVRFQRMKAIESESSGKKPVLSIGNHKIWIFASSAVRGHDTYNYLVKECPYLTDILPSWLIQ